MQIINRKKFLTLSALASGSVLIPDFLKHLRAGISPVADPGNKVLVVLQLSGGNDGLNTFIPFRNDLYYKLRPTLGYPESSVLKISDEMALNPAMDSMRRLYDQGDLCIINSIGYPNPDHSHFRSMDIWNTASASDEYISTGWLGRYLDSHCQPCNHNHHAIEVDDTLSTSLKGEFAKGLAISKPERLLRVTQDPFIKKLAEHPSVQTGNSAKSYLYKTLVETSSSVSYIYKQSKIYQSQEAYPANSFGNNLKLIAELICSGSETTVYYLSFTGFDTHAKQKPVHERLLKTFSDGLQVFISDLKKNNRYNDTLILAFSEFGRRAQQNGSNGTDHGEGNNLILAGGELKQKGFYNASPDLSDLAMDNVKFKVDFRSVYSTVLENWLKADAGKIIGSNFPKLNFI